MTDAAPVAALSGLLLLISLGVAVWALNRDRQASRSVIRRITRIQEENRILRAHVAELTAWGMYSPENPPRTPPPKPLFLDGEGLNA